MNSPNSFGGVRFNGGSTQFGSTIYGTNGHTQTVTTIGGVTHTMTGSGCTVTKPAPKVAG